MDEKWITVNGVHVLIGGSKGKKEKSFLSKLGSKKKTKLIRNPEKVENEKIIKNSFKKAEEFEKKGEFHKSRGEEVKAFSQIDINRQISKNEKPGRYTGNKNDPANNPYFQQHKYAKGNHLTDPAVQKDRILLKENTSDMKQAIKMGMARDKNRGKLRSSIFASEKKKIKVKK